MSWCLIRTVWCDSSNGYHNVFFTENKNNKNIPEIYPIYPIISGRADTADPVQAPWLYNKKKFMHEIFLLINVTMFPWLSWLSFSRHISLTMATLLWSFGCSKCKRVNDTKLYIWYKTGRDSHFSNISKRLDTEEYLFEMIST